MSDQRLQAFAERIERVLQEARDAGFDAEDIRRAIAERRRPAGVSALQRACHFAGGQTALAKKIGMAQPHLSKWLHRDKQGVPAKMCLAIEAAVGGRVTRYDLRPDVFGHAAA